MPSEGFDLEKICQCPSNMSWDKYNKLREEYSTIKKPTKKNFWKFVKENYPNH